MKTLTLRRAAASGLLAAAALLSHAGANAASVQYDFSTTIDFSTGTPAKGTSFFGSFSYDDELGGPDSFELTAFSFLFNGTSYDLDSLEDGAAALFDDATLLGLDTSSNKGGVILFLPAASSQLAASFAFEIANGGATGTGSFSASRVNGGNTIPEPATLLLVAGLLPLIRIGTARRQRDAG